MVVKFRDSQRMVKLFKVPRKPIITGNGNFAVVGPFCLSDYPKNVTGSDETQGSFDA